MVGLNGSGKTTILHKLIQDETMAIYPTHGFNIEMFEYKNTTFNIYEIGGKQNLRPLWKHYSQYAQDFIFVVDSEDQASIEEAGEELMFLLRDESLNEAALLVLANKQDSPEAMNVAEISYKLGLRSLNNRKWYILPTCALSGDGLYEGMEWLSKNAAHQK